MKKMTTKEAYAIAIKDFEIKTNSDFSGITTGYLTQSGKQYPHYFSNESFKEFVGKMSNEHRRQYDNGSGGELKEKKGRYGYYPPKMASFASSSRMIYLLSKDIEGFAFELNLSTGLHGKANLDGYRFNNDTYTFVEAKRQEIFDSHSPVRSTYQEIYDEITNSGIPFIIKYKTTKDCKLIPTFYCNEIEIHHFDLKQMISHLLGISRAFIIGSSSEGNFTLKDDKKISFLYLLYNPISLLEDSNLSKKEKETIRNRYNAVVKEINECAQYISSLFEVLFKYQANKLHATCTVPQGKFKFKLVDQDQYLAEF